MKTVPFSPVRVALIAHNTVLEAARQRLFNFLILLAFALVVGARWFRDFNFGAPELKFLADCGFGAMAFFGSALTIVATAQLFFSEIENRTALTLLAKPVWRTEFVLGKFCGVLVLIAAFCALLTALMIVVLWQRAGELQREFPDAFAGQPPVSYATVALAGCLQWLKLSVLAAFVLLVASFAQTQLFTVILGFFILVICHLQYLAQDVYGREGSLVGQYVAALIAAMLPNFQLFALADTLVMHEAPTAEQLLRILVYAGGYVAVLSALAVFSFRKREI
jgi:hypothetical protein